MYYDLLVKIKNAGAAKKDSLQTPFSKFDFAVAKVLEEAGCVKSAEKKNIGKKQTIEITLKYRDGKSAISDFKLKSKPSRRIYAGYRELRPVRQGYGIAVLSTPTGIMDNKDAKKKKVGGEYLFEVW